VQERIRSVLQQRDVNKQLSADRSAPAPSRARSPATTAKGVTAKEDEHTRNNKKKLSTIVIIAIVAAAVGILVAGLVGICIYKSRRRHLSSTAPPYEKHTVRFFLILYLDCTTLYTVHCVDDVLCWNQDVLAFSPAPFFVQPCLVL
jgi:heme/copper-type cytochrome/quinol oxidase subunit 2